MAQIAVVRLAPGQVGFFDNISGIHLSMANKEAKVLPGMNTAGLIKAVKEGKITVVSGSLGSETFVYAEQCMPTYYRLLDAKKKKMINRAKPIVISEQIIEEPKEEVKPTPKKKSKKKKQPKVVKEEVKVELEVVEIKEEVVEPVVEEKVEEVTEPIVEEVKEEVENKEE